MIVSVYTVDCLTQIHVEMSVLGKQNGAGAVSIYGLTVMGEIGAKPFFPNLALLCINNDAVEIHLLEWGVLKY